MGWVTTEFPTGFAEDTACQHDGCTSSAACRFVSVNKDLGGRRSTARCEKHAAEIRAKAGVPVPVQTVPADPLPPAPPAPAAPAPERKRVVFPIPEKHRITLCRSCTAAIIWIVTANGRRMPLEPYGDKRGESHFAHCAHADQHRKPR